MKFDKIIKNKYLYYAACALAGINLLGYVTMSSMECILLFVAATYSANHFTKNRTLDIFIGLFVANVLFGCGRIKEGMTLSSEVSDKLKDALELCEKNHATDSKANEECKNTIKKALMKAEK
jgi:uncharacterized membrane protein YgaE (UPF0421/DUF939 family)